MSPAPTEQPRLPPRLEPLVGELLADDASWIEAELTGDLVDPGGGGEVTDVEVAASILRGCRVSGITIERLRMTDVVLDGCDLSGTEMYGADLTRVVFESCRLSASALAGSRLHDVAFVRCKADGANLRAVRGTRVTFDDTVLSGADLKEATLSDARLIGCDLTDVDVTRAALPEAHLHRSTIEGLKGALHLKGAVIDGAQLVPLALRLFAELGIVVAEEPEDGP